MLCISAFVDALVLLHLTPETFNVGQHGGGTCLRLARCFQIAFATSASTHTAIPRCDRPDIRDDICSAPYSSKYKTVEQPYLPSASTSPASATLFSGASGPLLLTLVSWEAFIGVSLDAAQQSSSTRNKVVLAAIAAAHAPLAFALPSWRTWPDAVKTVSDSIATSASDSEARSPNSHTPVT